MFAIAHAFCGLLVGLAFLGITNDRRVVPLCILGALLPDLIDKPLALLVPALSCGRTLGHTLLFVLILSVIALIAFRYWHSILGIAFACSVFSHQICDSLWQQADTWFFPLRGPFPLMSVPDYTGYYLWLEITSPSEWLFLAASLVIAAGLLGRIPLRSLGLPIMAFILGLMGIFLITAGISGQGISFFAPSYTATPDVMAGLLALLGAAALILLYTGRIRNA
nr:metal-dependent hydrolase [uncultured Methanoregula sp.]